MNVAENFVRYALKIGAMELVPRGRKLKSGRISPYFFNSALFNTGETLTELAEAYVETGKITLRVANVDVIFGPAYKGIPLATVMTTVMYEKYGANIGFAFSRKEEKDHGEGGITVGYPLTGKKVCIVDDVMTTGTSSGKAADIIRVNGGTPVTCIIAFDRQERGDRGDLSAVEEFERDYEIPVCSVATLTDLITVLEKDTNSDVPHPTIPNGESALEQILTYRKKYGIIK